MRFAGDWNVIKDCLHSTIYQNVCLIDLSGRIAPDKPTDSVHILREDDNGGFRRTVSSDNYTDE